MQVEPLSPKIGKSMLIMVWIIVMGMLTWGFGRWETDQVNPNSSPLSTTAGGATQVTLMRNRQGHYLTSGKINQRAVTFLIDTGATTVAIPGGQQRTLGLSRGDLQHSLTANGTAKTYSTQIDKLEIGGIVLTNVRASILPNMPGTQILLGMSVLRELEFSQKGELLTLRQEHR